MASTGQPSIASLQSASSSGDSGLLVYVGMSTIVVTTEVRGRGFTAKIAVDALVIDVELSLYILGIFICGVGHFFKAGKNVGESRMNRN